MYLISEGVAFIMVGAVGLIMSTTTTDIGQGLMRAVREEGDKTRALNRELFRDFMEALLREGRQTRAMIGDVGKQIGDVGKQIGDVGKQIGELSRKIDERDARMEKRLDRMTSAIEAVSNDIKATSDDNREFFKQMLEAQNRILEKMSHTHSEK